MTTKTCPGAGEQVTHTEETTLFASDRSRIDALAPYCKKCAATKQREWKRKNPEKVRAAKAKHRLRLAMEPAFA